MVVSNKERRREKAKARRLLELEGESVKENPEITEGLTHGGRRTGMMRLDCTNCLYCSECLVSGCESRWHRDYENDDRP